MCLQGYQLVRAENVTKAPVDYVNTRIGNISLLLVPTYPTVHLPNSMLRMIPQHREFVTDRMPGLPLNIPSHRRGSAFRLLPYCGDHVGLNPDLEYRYDQEIIKPYEYSVFLDDQDIEVRFAPAAKAAIYSLKFERKGGRYVMLRTVEDGELQLEGNAWYGYEKIKGTKNYLWMEFDQKPIEIKTCHREGMKACYARFADDVDEVKVRYGISFLDAEQAHRNLEKEVPDYNIDKLAQAGRDRWNETLGKISIEGGTEDQKTVFYTALYRSHERMVNISEDGRYYNSFDGKIHDDEGVPFWTDDWIWDTYLALHPLQVILAPKEEEQKLASYIRMCEATPQKWMPTFPTIFGDSHSMNGNHAAVMFADALCKGLNFDVRSAFEGMKSTDHLYMQKDLIL